MACSWDEPVSIIPDLVVEIETMDDLIRAGRRFTFGI